MVARPDRPIMNLCLATWLRFKNSLVCIWLDLGKPGDVFLIRLACQDDKICTLLKAVIYGAVNLVQAIWDKNLTTEDWSRSSSRWDFHFHSYVLTIYVRLYWILELVVFYSLVRRGYIHKVSVQLVQIFFHMFAVLIVFHAANEKTGRKQD